MTRRTTSGPKPWPQREVRTTFLRVPTVDWPAVRQGHKTEFRATGRAVTQLWNVEEYCPTPVVGYAVTNARTDHDSKLLVLEATWHEPLAAISDDSLSREGFPDMAHFRRYWMERTKRRFAPLAEAHVYRIRPFTSEDCADMGQRLLGRLYGQHLPAE